MSVIGQRKLKWYENPVPESGVWVRIPPPLPERSNMVYVPEVPASPTMVSLRERLEDPIHLAHYLFNILSSSAVRKRLASKGMLLVCLEVVWLPKFSSLKIDMRVYKDGVMKGAVKKIDPRAFHHFMRRSSTILELRREFQNLLEVHLSQFILSWESGK